MIVCILLIIIGMVLLIKGADFLVEGASNIAQKFHIPEIIIGLTIVSIGTSMPELVVSVNSALNGHSDITIGNVIGSNLANLMLILGMCAAIKALPMKKQTRVFESPMAFAATIILFIMGNTKIEEAEMISRGEGFILLALCIMFIIYNIYMAKKGEDFDKEDEADESRDIEIVPVWKSLINIVIGIVGLKIGGDLVVNNAVEIATMLHISEAIIGLTIIAIGTSLPELVTSVTATLKGEADMAVGNVLGSQIFNILLITGTSAAISPIHYDTSYNAEMILLVIASTFFVACPYIGHKMHFGRVQGAIYVTAYLVYMLRLVILNIG